MGAAQRLLLVGNVNARGARGSAARGRSVAALHRSRGQIARCRPFGRVRTASQWAAEHVLDRELERSDEAARGGPARWGRSDVEDARTRGVSRLLEAVFGE